MFWKITKTHKWHNLPSRWFVNLEGGDWLEVTYGFLFFRIYSRYTRVS